MSFVVARLLPELCETPSLAAKLPITSGGGSIIFNKSNLLLTNQRVQAKKMPGRMLMVARTLLVDIDQIAGNGGPFRAGPANANVAQLNALARIANQIWTGLLRIKCNVVSI